MIYNSNWWTFFKTHRVTLSLVVINIIIFFSYFSWSISSLELLELGGNFAPYTLDKDVHRLFYSMFLHGNLIHLIMNAYSLVILGMAVESELGTLKTLEVYLISGLLAGLSSIYFNLFTISVGASGAIFGLYGYTIVRQFIRAEKASRFSLLANFVVYLVVMVGVGQQWGFDNAGHFGGLIAGVLLALMDTAPVYKKYFGMTSVIWLVLVLIYFLLPRFQVSYFKAFQFMIEADESINKAFRESKSDDEILVKIENLNSIPDSVIYNFRVIQGLPDKVMEDVSIIDYYMFLRKELFRFYRLGIERESFIYTDSIRHANLQMQQLPKFRYPLYMSEPEDLPQPPQDSVENFPLRREEYDEDWFPTDKYDVVYYRIGYQDSLNEWHGVVEDYYRNGAIQMRGTYNHGLKDGIFLYYNQDSTYSSAGSYRDDDSVGKWEVFYSENRLHYEMRYEGRRAYMLNYYDSFGNSMVIDGEGEEREYFPNGQLRYKATIKKGRREGIAMGYEEDGRMLFQENFEDGYLLYGVSYPAQGTVYKYDVTARQPFPKGGFNAFHDYLDKNATYKNDSVVGSVVLRFAVHKNGWLSNIRYIERMGEPYDTQAKNLLLKGPPWAAAKRLGYELFTTDTEIIVNY